MYTCSCTSSEINSHSLIWPLGNLRVKIFGGFMLVAGAVFSKDAEFGFTGTLCYTFTNTLVSPHT